MACDGSCFSFPEAVPLPRVLRTALPATSLYLPLGAWGGPGCTPRVSLAELGQAPEKCTASQSLCQDEGACPLFSHLPARGSPKAPPRYAQKGALPCVSSGGGPSGAETAASDVALLRAHPPTTERGCGRQVPVAEPQQVRLPICGKEKANLASSQSLSPRTCGQR